METSRSLDAAASAAPPTEGVEGLGFEELLSRLGGVVERLERGDLPLEESLQIFEEGIRLSRLGARRLAEAERRVELLLEGEGARTRPLPDKEPDHP